MEGQGARRIGGMSPAGFIAVVAICTIVGVLLIWAALASAGFAPARAPLDVFRSLCASSPFKAPVKVRLTLGKKRQGSSIGASLAVLNFKRRGARVVVSEVAAKSLAEKAGLRAGDHVLRVSGHRVRTPRGCILLLRGTSLKIEMLVERERAPVRAPVAPTPPATPVRAPPPRPGGGRRLPEIPVAVRPSPTRRAPLPPIPSKRAHRVAPQPPESPAGLSWPTAPSPGRARRLQLTPVCAAPTSPSIVSPSALTPAW